MAISNINAQAGISRLMVSSASNPQVQNAKDLVHAVRTGDAKAAQQAYVSIVKAAPEGATWPKDSAFSELGKALAKGDLDAAKSIVVEAVKAARGHGTDPVPMPAPAPAPAGGAVGSVLNVAA
ncbi:MAG: hypothetical protein HUU30_13745 [Burkholderiaceae bacterium]|nr:hypothetical protein [Aquabacterium sp.]NUP86797.1 hypothetical protein [Burkholderiaceae bacterium]